MKSLISLYQRFLTALNAIPHSFLAIPLRLAVATVFWNSALTKLTDWDATVFLFREEYHVPVLPPEFAALLAVSMELSMPILLTMGLATRLAALALLGMTTVIQVFIYPMAWPTHIQWIAMLLVIIARGPGVLSLDHVITKLWQRRFPH